MPTYQLCLDVPLPDLIDDIARAAAEVAPGLGFDEARDVADLLLRTRVRQTVSCGVEGDCAPDGRLVFGGRAAAARVEVRPCRLHDADAVDLPWMFAACCADRLLPSAVSRPVLELRLAGVFRQALAPRLRASTTCGVSPVCRAEATDPFSDGA